MISFLIHFLLWMVLLNFQISVNFHISFIIEFFFILLWLKNILGMISVCSHYWYVSLWSAYGLHWHVLQVHLKRICILLLGGWHVPHLLAMFTLKSCWSLLFHCWALVLLDLTIIETEYWLSNFYCWTVSSIQFSRSVVSDSLRPHESQHARPPCPLPTPGVHWDSRPSSQWCHQAISSSVVHFSSGPNPSQNQSLSQWVNSLHEMAKVLEFQL